MVYKHIFKLASLPHADNHPAVDLDDLFRADTYYRVGRPAASEHDIFLHHSRVDEEDSRIAERWHASGKVSSLFENLFGRRDVRALDAKRLCDALGARALAA